jgi:hypothetical protein
MSAYESFYYFRAVIFLARLNHNFNNKYGLIKILIINMMVCQFYWCVYHVSVLLVCYCIFVKEISSGAALTIDFVNGVCSTDALTIDSFFYQL